MQNNGADLTLLYADKHEFAVEKNRWPKPPADRSVQHCWRRGTGPRENWTANMADQPTDIKRQAV